MRAFVVTSLAATSFFATLQQPQQVQSVPSAHLAPACPNQWLHDPVLVYDVVDATVPVTAFEHLVVYSDGHALLSATTDASDPGRAATVTLSGAEVAQLRLDLQAAGAFEACDDPAGAGYFPLSTITVFRGAVNPAAHTFSYAAPTQGSDPTHRVVQQFLLTYFAGF
jgi:hypothetical protein